MSQASKRQRRSWRGEKEADAADTHLVIACDWKGRCYLRTSDTLPPRHCAQPEQNAAEESHQCANEQSNIPALERHAMQRVAATLCTSHARAMICKR